MTEQETIQDLVSKWVSVALEYAEGAQDVRAIYIYVSSEQGSSYANAHFDQAGTVVMPGRLASADAGAARSGRMQDVLQDDLFVAEEAFARIGVPAPTEYRVYYEPSTRKLDVQLSRELIYASDPVKTPFDGIVTWLGDRAPRLF